MSLQRFLSSIFILSVILAAISCNNDWLTSDYDATVQWEGAYEGPIIFGNLSLKDLLEEFDTTGYVSEDSTGFLYAAYSKDTILRASDLVKIPDQQFFQVFFRSDTNIPGSFLGMLGDTIPFVQDKGFQFEHFRDERLDSIYVKDGEMRIWVRSTIKHEGILTISSDYVFFGGQKYHKVIMISDPSGNYDTTVSIPMAGSTILLDNSVPDSSSLEIQFEFDLINSGADILSSEEVQIINSFHELEYAAAYGYAGALDSVLIDKAELEFDLLQGNFEGTIKLANPQIIVRTNNSMGVPFAVELNDLEARFQDGSSTALTIDPSANPISIAAPDFTQVGQSVKDSTRIDTTNSNIHLAATTDLRGFQYSVRVIANPEGQQDNFILDVSELNVNVEGLVPLHLRIQDVVLTDTFDFDLFSDEDTVFGPDNIDNMLIRMETDNFMPLDLGIQIYFIDTSRSWQPLDSLFGEDKNVFLSGVVNSSGRVILATNKVTEVEMSREQIKNVVDANKLLMKAYIETTDNGSRDVKFYSDYSLNFKLGTRIELHYTIEPEGH
jgi:hypothetical protein